MNVLSSTHHIRCSKVTKNIYTNKANCVKQIVRQENTTYKIFKSY